MLSDTDGDISHVQHLEPPQVCHGRDDHVFSCTRHPVPTEVCLKFPTGSLGVPGSSLGGSFTWTTSLRDEPVTGRLETPTQTEFLESGHPGILLLRSGPIGTHVMDPYLNTTTTPMKSGPTVLEHCFL